MSAEVAGVETPLREDHYQPLRSEIEKVWSGWMTKCWIYVTLESKNYSTTGNLLRRQNNSRYTVEWI